MIIKCIQRRYPIYLLFSIRNLHASSFNLDSIDDEDKNLNLMPNITTLNNFSRSIGAVPETGTLARVGVRPGSASVNPASTVCHSIRSDFSESRLIPISGPSQIVNSNTFSSFTAIPNISPSAGFDENGSERPLKKARNESNTFKLELENYIQAELYYYSFKKIDKRSAMRKTIELIANNDYEGFMAHEPVFEAAFKHGYHLFKRGYNKADYMMHYIVRFGATDFLDSLSYSGRVASEDTNLAGAFEHLIATKPLDVLFVFLKKGRHIQDICLMKAISCAVIKRYPNMHFLDYIVFEADYFGIKGFHFDNALKIYKGKTEKDKLNYLKELLEFFNGYVPGPHFSHARFLEVPFRYEEYFLSLNIDLQYHFAIFAVVNGDLDKLTGIVELVPDVAVYFSKGNLFIYAARFNWPHIIKFFMEIVPELVNYEVDEKYSPIGIAIDYGRLELLDIFKSFGYDFTLKFQFHGRLLTPIQIAFKIKKLDSFSYFLAELGPKEARKQLLQVYGKNNEIMRHVMLPNPCLGLIEILRDKLDFNLKDNYYFYRGKTGNIMIFLKNDRRIHDFYKSRLDL